MAAIKELNTLTVTPGIRRDGTLIDGDFYSDGQWVRFQRGRPKKMGGFRMIANNFVGPIDQVLVWTRNLVNAVYAFSSFGVEAVLVDNNGLGNSKINKTPVDFVPPQNTLWSVDTMYDDAVGSKGTIIVAVPTSSGKNIADVTDNQVYWGLVDDGQPMDVITGLSVSGGVLCIAPYLVYYGSDGLVGWSDANQPQVLTGGDAGSDRITGSKIVKGLPVRGGNGPSALLWSLESLISMQYVGGSAIFRFTTISSQTSILSQNSVIEYDGSYFWVGIDRFLVYTGGQVQELPNSNNLNWFFDNLNFDQRQKVWAMKVPRFGEIWWFYPRDHATECTHAVIFNIREKTWYDCELGRSAGFYSQVFRYPVMSSSTPSRDVVLLDLNVTSGSFAVGDYIKGAASGTVAFISEKMSTRLYEVTLSNPGTALEELETVNNTTQSGVAVIAGIQPMYGLYTHEHGLNAVEGDQVSAIPSWFETCDLGYPTGGPSEANKVGLNRWLRMVRVEPDFNQTGEMSVEVISREFPQTQDITSAPFTFDSNTGKIDMREQGRLIRLRFLSNTLNGFYEMGRTILHTEPGDGRS